LGRALEAAATDQREKLTERKEKNAQAMGVMQQDIEEARKTGEIPHELTSKLKDLEKQNEKFEKELSKIRKTPELLTVRGAVFYPCVFLTAALVLNGTAWYLSLPENPNWWIVQGIWIVSLAAIGYSIYRICKTLKVIQNVAITSEEAWIKKTVEAFKIAEKEIDEEKRPEVRLTFRKAKFPLEMSTDSEIAVKSTLNVSKGDFIENVEVHIGVPAGFELPKAENTYTTSSEHTYSNYIWTTWELGTMITGIQYDKVTTIKSPLTVGNFKIVYHIVGRGLLFKSNEFELIVK